MDNNHSPALPSPLPSDGRGEGQGEVRVPPVHERALLASPVTRRSERGPGISNRKSSNVNRQSQSGIALIITLILLSVTLIMAVAFLAVSRRERSSVTTTTDAANARLAADAALAHAEAQVLANALAGGSNELGNAVGNPFNYGLLVSTNYINTNGFVPGSGPVDQCQLQLRERGPA